MSANNRVGENIEAEILKHDTKIETKIDDIKADHMKNIDWIDMKI